MARAFAATVFLLAICVAGTAFAANLYEPQRGTAERKGILDALRPAIEAEMRGPVEFVVSSMKTDGVWAFAIVDPQRPGGGAIDLSKTGWARDADFMDGATVYALVRYADGRWNLIDHVTGPTDVAFEPWPEIYGAPRALFGF